VILGHGVACGIHARPGDEGLVTGRAHWQSDGGVHGTWSPCAPFLMVLFICYIKYSKFSK
jgi:hypothetical protein